LPPSLESVSCFRSMLDRYVQDSARNHSIAENLNSPAQFLPTSVQKSYFMLSHSARSVLDIALQKYRPGRTDPILVGGIAQLKPALQLMTAYRVVIRRSRAPRF
jgi:hypothetical protein